MGLQVIGVGKIFDIFAGEGITKSYPAKNNSEGLEKIIALIKDRKWQGLLWANLVDFDMLWGHRNDIEGYARGLEEFDAALAQIIQALGENDVLIITADHGCDPTTPSTDHSREYVPLLVFGSKVQGGIDIGTRSTFADVGATVAELLGIVPLPTGNSLVEMIFKK
jgi:phosphopentomutase